MNHRCGWVALMGPPNAGKSTLINALVGQKVAIVTSKPQTTRNQIVGILTQPDMQAIFVDTPGIGALRGHVRGHLSKRMLQAAWQSLATANCVVLVLDGELYLRRPEFLDRDLSPLEPLATDERPVVIAINKVDLFHDKSRMLPLLESLAAKFPKAELFPISALRWSGIEQLIELLKRFLPEGEALYPADQLSTLPTKFMVAELIREKLFEKLYQEVPYAVAVEIETWEEDEEQAIINAAIYVARPSHKAMVIGRAGAGIKAIGTAARRETRDLLHGKKVHLELWVRVREDWLDDPQFIDSQGFSLETF